MIQTITASAFVMPDRHGSLLILHPEDHLGRRESPQGFTQAHLLSAIRLADREALSCVRSFGQPRVGAPGYETYAAPPIGTDADREASLQQLREWREAAEWLDWRRRGNAEREDGVVATVTVFIR